eukprot:1921898-Rhodomonas_salina.2
MLSYSLRPETSAIPGCCSHGIMHAAYGPGTFRSVENLCPCPRKKEEIFQETQELWAGLWITKNCVPRVLLVGAAVTFPITSTTSTRGSSSTSTPGTPGTGVANFRKSSSGEEGYVSIT